MDSTAQSIGLTEKTAHQPIQEDEKTGKFKKR